MEKKGTRLTHTLSSMMWVTVRGGDGRRSSGEGIGYSLQYSYASLVAQMVKNLPAVQEAWVQTLGQEDPLGKAQAWKPGSQHAGEKRGVAGLLLGRTERAARAAELQLCAQAR